MKRSFINKFGLNSNHIFLIVFILGFVMTIPIFFLYTKVIFDAAIFLTEYQRIVWEGLVIGFILTFVGLFLEHRKEATADEVFIQNNLLISKEDLSNILIREMKIEDSDIFDLSPIMKFHWDVIHSFFSERKYFSIKREEVVRQFFELHANLTNQGSIEVASGYFTTGKMTKKHMDFVIELLNSINFIYEDKTRL